MVWVFDRSLTEFENNVPVFIDTIREHTLVQEVFKELSHRLGKSIDAIRNTYASPIFRLGIAYKVNVDRLIMGQVTVKPADIGIEPEEYRLTGPARLLCEGKISMETFFLINAIRFQSLNSTLQRNYFEELQKINHNVLPLILCLQILRELESMDINQAYISFEELPWLTERTSQLPTDITDYAKQLVSARSSSTTLSSTHSSSRSYVDAWFKWFHATRVVIDKQQVRIAGGSRIRALVLAADRSMVVNRILNNPPVFIPLPTFEERYKWAVEYIKTPTNLEMYFPPKEPLILKVSLPTSSSFNSATNELSIPWPLAAGFKERVNSNQGRRGTHLALGDQLSGLDPSVVYEVTRITFPGDGSGLVTLCPTIKSVDPSKNVASLIDTYS